MSFGRSLLLVPLLAVTLGACDMLGGNEDAELAPEKAGKAQATSDKIAVTDGEAIGTPMAERVAVLGLLNKRNGQTRDIELKPGEAIRLGKVVVRLRPARKLRRGKPFPMRARSCNCWSTNAPLAPPKPNAGGACFRAGCSRKIRRPISCSIRSMTSGSRNAG